MPTIEKRLAEELVDYRQQQATGTGFVPIAVHIDALQGWLDREMEMRAAIGALVGEGS
jgi:hypothetical protein